MKLLWKYWPWYIFLPLFCFSQRTYTTQSVLSNGEWFKIAVNEPGIYKIDIPFLQKLGFRGSSFPSSAIRLFGNGGAMLPEACNGHVTDDLTENAIMVIDGGDGVLNGNDYILFFAEGPHHWRKDSLNKKFQHEKNLFAEKSFYFLSLNGNGKRILLQPSSPVFNTTVTSYDERYFYELDTVNFLGSGKQWFGDEFSSDPGQQTSRSFSTNIKSFIPSLPVSLQSNCVARSVGGASRFNLRVNNQQLLQLDIPATTVTATDPFAKQASGAGSALIPDGAPVVQIDFTPGGAGAQGWIDWFEFFCRRDLSMINMRQLFFRDWNSVSPGVTAQFKIKNAAGALVWDVTNSLVPVQMQTTVSGTDLSFVNDCYILKEYISFNPDSAYTPEAIGRINNQNLHQLQPTPFVVVTESSLQSEANRIGALHLQRENIHAVVATTDQVFNEFSSGSPDPTAIRDFVKMLYDRAGSDTTRRPKYLLLLGDASFDYKDRLRNNTNMVPAYESTNSLDPLNTYTSDDFFGYLDDSDDINSPTRINLLDIAVGRIPAQNVGQAKAYADKLIAYTSPAALGSWRNQMTFVADDEDFNLHLHDAETITAAAKSTNPLFNQDKIYLDAYQQQSSAGGATYPAATQAVEDDIYNGTLLFNYTGHGGSRRLAEEVILDQDIINRLNNANKLPLFVTATCDFAPYDDPRIHSIGEDVLLREKTGAIACMSTTRLVFAYSNKVMNQNYLQTALARKADGSYRSLGDATRDAKNFTYQTYGDIVNNRKFTLLGDPVLTVAFPHFSVQTDSVNNKSAAVADTLKALQHCTVAGHVTDALGLLQSTFNGTLTVSVFDKEQTQTTLGNDPESYPESFQVQKSLIYKGKATVANGKFRFDFVVPKDINYQFGNGSISYYVDNGATDGNGRYTAFVVGGSGSASTDITGPDIHAWLNDEKFVDGGVTNETPILIVKLQDSSGINILGTGIGHDLVAMLDADPKQTFVLNRFYESELDNYKKGEVKYQLPDIPEGKHVIKIKAWDVANNSSETMLEFTVQGKNKIVLQHVLNYPNPFTSHTNFWFEHNRPFEQLQVSIRIFTVSGKLIKTLSKTIFSEGNRSTELEWDGKDDYGDKVGRGVYIYILRVKAADGTWADKVEKLMIL